MVKTFHVTARQRRFNAALRALTRIGIPLGPFWLLSVRGRKTGKTYTVPVAPLTWEGKRWLVAPYGEVNWVRPYFEATAQSDLTAFVAEASRHPAFQLVDPSTSSLPTRR